MMIYKQPMGYLPGEPIHKIVSELLLRTAKLIPIPFPQYVPCYFVLEHFKEIYNALLSEAKPNQTMALLT